MKISYKGDYAIKSLVYLSYIYKQEGGALRFVQLSEIASKLDIPVKFLEQIMLILKSGGYIQTLRGKHGGYALSKAPAEIRLGEIIRLIDGPTSPIACVSCSAYKYCDYENKCVLKPIWQQVREATNAVVDNITFEELAKKEEAIIMGRQALTYII
jgi:Rrf2 family protein